MSEQCELTIGKNVDSPDHATVALLEKAGRRRRRLRCECGTVLVNGACSLCAVAEVEKILGLNGPRSGQMEIESSSTEKTQPRQPASQRKHKREMH